MANVVGDIAVSVGADISPLERDMARAGRSVRGFERSTTQSAAVIAKRMAAIGVAVAGAATSIIAIAGRAASTAAEIDNLSKLAGTSAETFQRMAAGAQTVGISQEKLADILKDVNDRVGDFINTGGGPMADFFERIAPQVGVTADQFARLSGPEALQLYVSSLEAANATQAEMTFYMEAMASDATALVPLLRNGGAGFRQLGDEAAAAGRVMGQDAVDAGKRLDIALTEMSNTMRVSVNEAILENIDSFERFTDVLAGPVVDRVAATVGEFGRLASIVLELSSDLDSFIRRFGRAGEAIGDTLSDPLGIGKIRDTINDLRERPGNDTGTPLSLSIDRLRRAQGGEFDYGALLPPPAEPGFYGSFNNGGLSTGEGLSGEPNAALERLQETIAQEEEIRSSGHRRIEQEEERHQTELDRIREKYQGTGLAQTEAFFGDLASIYSSGNDGLSRITRAAAGVEATINAGRAAAQVLGDPSLPFFAKFAAVAKTWAAGQQIVSAISSGRIGGAAAGGAGAAAPAAAPVAPLQAELNLQGPFAEALAAALDPLLDGLNRAAGDRGYQLLVRRPG